MMRFATATRRRVLRIFAGIGAAAFLPAAASATTFTWSGFALGADARITLAGVSAAQANRIVALATAEIERLESIFSLYRADSEISRLNRDGAIAAPSQDLRLLLHRSIGFWHSTGGCFNPAVQPIWTCLARHFASGAKTGPDPKVLGVLAQTCNPGRISLGAGAIRLGEGMAVTLNGIAQGYITDRVAELLAANGFRDILLQLGEVRALPGRSWQVGVPGKAGKIELSARAVATSQPVGTLLEPSGRWHHLIDPRTGRSAEGPRSVTVIAADATTADALSTAFAVAPQQARQDIAIRFPGVTILGIESSGAEFSMS